MEISLGGNRAQGESVIIMGHQRMLKISDTGYCVEKPSQNSPIGNQQNQGFLISPPRMARNDSEMTADKRLAERCRSAP